ncbi:AAA family ATPase [Sanguibacter suaedae]|uniref:MinD-like ATPase involved in chromosome partitioning or flagellar assembly n=1 Tax=Sanguibacter suaedae TaxID=2795737 RepID=A0A934MEV4_9MICO|nr:hypothetical protein [Sanguibacter suaedae]MBI9116039.1 hypothetical protein [Sanguibacter suaedae]
MTAPTGLGATPPTTVLCAVRGAAEADVVSLLASPAAGLHVTRRCADLAELLAAAAAGLGTVAVVSADLAGLDRPVVAALHGEGVRVVAVLAQGDPDGAARTGAIGVDAAVPADALDSTLVATVRTTAAQGPRPGPAQALSHGSGRPSGEDRWADAGTVTTATPARSSHEPQPPGRPRPRTGAVVAVWGPAGAPGRTTVALTLAAELACRVPDRRGRARRASSDRTPARDDVTLLVDADTYAASVAQVAGLLDESSGLAAACRAAGRGALDLEDLARLAPEMSEGLRVLTGITRAARWPEINDSALDVVWEKARELADRTVVDCGFSLERDELLSYDTRAPQRNAATLSALRAADVVVVVGGADPVGVQRLVRALDDLRECELAPFTETVVVVNRLRAASVGPRPGSAVREALLRYANVTDVRLVPDDPAACDAARLAGRTLTEHAPTSAARRALVELADHVRALTASSPQQSAVPGTRDGTGWAQAPSTVAH